MYVASAAIAQTDLLMSGELRDVAFVADEYFGLRTHSHTHTDTHKKIYIYRERERGGG